MKRTVKQRVDEFRKKNPKAYFVLDEMSEIMELGNEFDIIMTAFYFGYMRGQNKAKKGCARK